MHRRPVLFLVAFLVAIAVVGGSGVRAPWVPGHDQAATPVATRATVARAGVIQKSVRVE